MYNNKKLMNKVVVSMMCKQTDKDKWEHQEKQHLPDTETVTFQWVLSTSAVFYVC